MEYRLLRRRPPRIPNISVFCLLSALLTTTITTVFAQTTSTLQSSISKSLAIPSITLFDLSSVSNQLYYIPSGTANGPIYITLSICSTPPTLASTLPSVLPPILYFSNSSQALPIPLVDTPPSTRIASSNNGFANLTLASIPTEGIYVGIWAPNNQALGGSSDGLWNFELRVTPSPDGGVVIDSHAGYRFEDSDQSNALLTTTNFTSSTGSTSGLGGSGIPTPNYTAIIIPTTILGSALSSSVCYVQSQLASGGAAVKGIVESNTTRGYGGGLRVQYQVVGLNGGTNYTSWLLAGTGVSRRLWSPNYFVTKTSTSCRLVHSLDFCPSVAYAVPSPPNLSTASLLSFYSASLDASLETFARTLSTFPCNSTSMGFYSFVSTCEDCKARYLDWTCAVTMPRCSDPPQGSSIEDTNSTEWTLPANYETLLIRDNPLASRTPLFAQNLLDSTFPPNTSTTISNTTSPSALSFGLTSPFPYSEVPPCLDVCSLVKAQCPPLVQWNCPITGKGGTGTAGYGETRSVDRGARMAGEVGSNYDRRAGDRYGNIFCNSLGTEMRIAAQFSGGRSLGPSTSVVVGLLSPFLCLFFIGSY